MKCDESRTLLAVHRDLSRAQEHQLQLHLAGCARCAAVKQELGLSARLWSGLPEPSPAAVQRVVVRAPLQLPEARRPAVRRGALTLSALALVAALALFFWLPGSKTPGASGATTPEPTAPAATLDPTPAPVESGAPVTITVHALMVDKQIYQPLAETFMAQNPDIHVRVVGFDEGLRVRSASDNAAEYSAYLAGEVDVVDSGWLLVSDTFDLRPFMWVNPAFHPSNYYQPALEFVEGGMISRLPFAIELPLASYNRQLWAERGLPPPESPLSTAQILEAAAQLASTEDGSITTYGYFDEGGNLLPQHNFERAGISFKRTPIEQLRLNTPEGVQALEQAAEWLQRGVVLRPQGSLFPSSSEGLTPPDYESLIQQQQLGIWATNLDTVESVARRTFDTGTLVSDSAYPWVYTYSISAASKHPEAAWRWLAYLSSQDIQRDSHRASRLLPAQKSVAQASGYWTQLDPERERAVQLALQGRPLNSPIVTPEDEARIVSTNNYLNYLGPLIKTALDDVLEGRTSAQEALDVAQSKLDEWWPKDGAPAPTPSP